MTQKKKINTRFSIVLAPSKNRNSESNDSTETISLVKLGFSSFRIQKQKSDTTFKVLFPCSYRNQIQYQLAYMY